MVGRKSTSSKYIRRKLLACRVRLGLSQNEVAKTCGINRGYYTKIENGIVTPSIFIFKRLADVLKTDWKEIVDVQEVEPNS